MGEMALERRWHMLDTIILIVYLVAMLVLGIYCVRYIKTYDDFFVSGRGLGFGLAVGTTAALFVGGSAIGVAGMGYDYGIGAIWYYIAYAVGFVILGVTFTAPLRAMNEYTIADIFAWRYGEQVRFTSSILTLVSWVFFFAAFVIAGARVVEVAMGWPLWICILATAGIFTIYTSIGGMWAVTMTDTVQFIMLLAGMLIIFPVSINAVGGFTGLYNSLDPSYFALIPEQVGGVEFNFSEGLGYVVSTLFITGVTGVVGPDLYIRIWCAKDARTAKNVLYLTAALMLFGALMLAMVGMSALVLNPTLEAEFSMPWIIRELLPPGIAGLVLVALMAAAIAGAVPELVVCASIIAQDIYRKKFRPEADDKELLTASRVISFAVGAIGMILAVVMPGFMDLTYNCYRIFVPTVCPIVILAFYSKRINNQGAMASMISGFVVSIFCIFAFPETLLTWFDPVFPSTIISVVLLYVVSALKPSTEPEREASFLEFSKRELEKYAEEKAARKAAKRAARG